MRKFADCIPVLLLALAIALVIILALTSKSDGQEKRSKIAPRTDTTVARVVYIQTLKGQRDQVMANGNQIIQAIDAQIRLLENMTQDSITIKKQ